MAGVRSFHRYRGEASFSLQEFISVLREQLPLVAPVQTKYRVTQLPSERTIRFYTGKGLVDKPLLSTGGRHVYGYRQLLQVLAVKVLQAQYLPLVKVRSLIAGAENRELEQLIPAIAPAAAAHRLVVRRDRPEASPQAPAGAGAGGRAAPPDADPDVRRADLWHRVEVAPGIELHVHEAALADGQRERLRGALLREIGVLRGWFGEEGTS